MINLLKARLRQGHRTQPFPPATNPLPERFRGLPVISSGPCADKCQACVEACPTGAITTDGGVKLDLAKCLFCPACVEACPEGKIAFSKDYALASTSREALVLDDRGHPPQSASPAGGDEAPLRPVPQAPPGERRRDAAAARPI